MSQREFPPQAFTFPPAGKPRLAGGPHFSISHSNSVVSCIVCAETDCGIDIEDRLDSADSATIAKLRRWTATEAALKAAGLGLRAAGQVALADRLEHAVVRSQRYELQSLDVVPGLICHIAARQKLTPIIAPVELDDARTSVLLERSLGLAAQFQ